LENQWEDQLLNVIKTIIIEKHIEICHHSSGCLQRRLHDGEQRVRVRVPNAQGLHRTTQFLMQEYLNLVDWKGLELPSTERNCKASVKKFECSPTVLAEWIELKETFAEF